MSDLFASGVSFYTHATVTVPIHFPEREICCWYCPLYNKRDNECILTGETVYNGRKFVGEQCPAVPLECPGKEG